ncbi:MAG: WYL domain-containing protein [Kiritimatiellae bacterium]|jgi:predicted DNA-binding transcriptional regulator YafY|nr:WYL domain-containing protein [Kiritimatiellia bacterium]
MPTECSPQQWERLLHFVDLLRDGGCPGREELARDWEVNVRTVQRMVDFLRDRLEAPIIYDRKHRGYVLTEPTWFLPHISLSEGECFSLLIARQAMAQYRGTPVEKTLAKVFRKIAGELNDRIDMHPDYVNDGILSFAPLPVLDVNEQVWNCVLTAIRQQRTLRICYQSLRSGTTTTRKVDPHHILNMQGDWYLFAHDHRNEKICQFQLHRIREAEPTDAAFERDPDFNAATLMQSSFGGFGSDEDMVTVHLRIRGRMAELMKDRHFHPSQAVKNRKDGFEIRFPVSAAGDRPYLHVMQWILGMGREVEVLAPDDLRHRLAKEVAAMQENLPDPGK